MKVRAATTGHARFAKEQRHSWREKKENLSSTRPRAKTDRQLRPPTDSWGHFLWNVRDPGRSRYLPQAAGSQPLNLSRTEDKATQGRGVYLKISRSYTGCSAPLPDYYISYIIISLYPGLLYPLAAKERGGIMSRRSRLDSQLDAQSRVRYGFIFWVP